MELQHADYILASDFANQEEYKAFQEKAASLGQDVFMPSYHQDILSGDFDMMMYRCSRSGSSWCAVHSKNAKKPNTRISLGDFLGRRPGPHIVTKTLEECLVLARQGQISSLEELKHILFATDQEL